MGCKVNDTTVMFKLSYVMACTVDDATFNETLILQKSITVGFVSFTFGGHH